MVTQNSFSEINERLHEISREVGRADISLDSALELLEEATQLGMRASNVLEEAISADEQAQATQMLSDIDTTEAQSPDEVVHSSSDETALEDVQR